ncbi:MAG: class I SAM-dependent methyltransferase, partial [Alphaproteobacteria bacterium]|nr:class I SAM-dependent methyltransferase [Alphaproteobacteria bacterium]
GFSAEVTPFQADLSGGLSALPAQDADIVTASALLDLVSAEWLELLVGFCCEHRLACYAALSYDGDMGWNPQDRMDDDLHALFDRHQRGEKSFGRALGPDAARATAECFTAAGFTVQSGKSDWQMGGEDRDMQEALLAGYVQAARELAPDRSAEIELWRQRRRMAIGIGSSRHRVGHIDILAIPKS